MLASPPDSVFAGFERRELPTSRGRINAMVGGSGPPLLLLHGYPESLLMWQATAPAAGRAAHRGRDRPRRLRRLVPAPAHARSQRAQQARAGPRPGRGDGAARVHLLRRGRSRPRRARRVPDGARPSGARGAPRRARHRPHRRGVGAGGRRRRARVLALGLPGAARAAAGAADRRRPGRVLRPPRPRPTRPRGGARGLPARARRPRRRRGDVRGLPRGRHRRPRARRRRTRGGAADRMPRAGAVGGPRRPPALLPRRARRLASLGRRRPRRGCGRQALPGRGAPARDRADLLLGFLS